MEHGRENTGIRRNAGEPAGGLAVATALAGALFEANTETASAQKARNNAITAILDGFSTDSASFQVSSFSFGVSNSGSAHAGGGGGAGKASFADITFTKNVDAATVSIFDAVARGRHLEKATFSVTGNNGAEIAKITLQDVIVSSQSFSAADGAVGVESVALNYGGITIAVDGATASWNLMENAEG